jgi:hypothetical protein
MSRRAPLLRGIDSHEEYDRKLNFVVSYIRNRRSIDCANDDPRALLESLQLNDDFDKEELELLAQKDSKKMLLLGDGFMLGINGFEMDFDRGVRCYSAAAYGCSESEVEQYAAEVNVADPEGNPEACCASAEVVCRMLIANYVSHSDSFEDSLLLVIRKARQNHTIMHKIGIVIYWLAAAAKKKWISPLTSVFAKQLEKSRMIFPNVKEDIRCIFDALYEKEPPQQHTLPRPQPIKLRSNPSLATLNEFENQAKLVFQTLKVLHVQVQVIFI